MKTLRPLIAFLLLIAPIFTVGCGEDPPGGGTGDGEKDPPLEETCDLLSFSIPVSIPNSIRTNQVEHDIEFVVDEENHTVKGVYNQTVAAPMPEKMTPVFTHNGRAAKHGNMLVGSGLANIAFAEEFELTIVAENNDEKVYKVSLDWVPFVDPRSEECDLLAFGIKRSRNGALGNDINFSLDASTRIAKGKYLPWIDSSEPEMMIPDFSVSPGAKVFVWDEEVTSGVTPVYFAEDVPLVVMAENEVDFQTYTITLVAPQINTELPVLHFSDINASQITSKDIYIKSRLNMYSHAPESGGVGWWSENDSEVEIRGRGNSTWGLPKKPYRVKFPRDISPVGLNHAKAKSWVLLANDIDKSLLRNHLAYGVASILFNKSEGYHDPNALMFTPCSQHVNVYFNGSYHGVYQMTDQMQQGEGRLELDELTAADGTSKTGGYMLEATFTAESPYFSSNRKNFTINMKYPDSDDYVIAQQNWIDSFIGNAENALYGSSWLDKTNGWRKWWDEKSWADFIIVKELMGDMDGYTCTYFYKRAGVEKLFMGPVWDIDKGFGNDKRSANSNSPATSLMIKAGFQMQGTHNLADDWPNHVWGDPDFRQLVADRWASKRNELVSYVLAEIDRMEAAMPKSIEANFDKWQFNYQANSGEAPLPAATYELELDRMRDWIENRANLLDRLFNQAP